MHSLRLFAIFLVVGDIHECPENTGGHRDPPLLFYPHKNTLKYISGCNFYKLLELAVFLIDNCAFNNLINKSNACL